MAWAEKYANFDLTTGLNDGSSEANAWKTPAAVVAGVAAGDRVNIKRQATAYDLTTTVTFNVNGTATAPIWYRAYTSTIGDGGLWEVAYNSGGIASLQFTGTYNYVEGIHFKAGASTNLHAFHVNAAGSIAIRCYAKPTSTSSITNSRRCWFEMAASGGGGYFDLPGTNAHPTSHIDTVFRRVGTTSASYLVYNDHFGRYMLLERCTFIGNGNSGEDGVFLDRADSGRGANVKNCIFYNFDDGFVVDEEPNSDQELVWVEQSVFDTMAGYGVKRTNTEQGFVHLLHNYYRSCTSGFTNYAAEADLKSGTALTASPFVDTSTQDFDFNSTSGGGQVLRDAGFYPDPRASSGFGIEPFASLWKEVASSSGGAALARRNAGVGAMG